MILVDEGMPSKAALVSFFIEFCRFLRWFHVRLPCFCQCLLLILYFQTGAFSSESKCDFSVWLCNNDKEFQNCLLWIYTKMCYFLRKYICCNSIFLLILGRKSYKNWWFLQLFEFFIYTTIWVWRSCMYWRVWCEIYLHL